MSAPAAGAAQVDRECGTDGEVHVDGTVKAAPDSGDTTNLGSITRMQLDEANASLDHLMVHFKPPNDHDMSEVTIPEAVAVALDLAAAAQQSVAASPKSLAALPKPVEAVPIPDQWQRRECLCQLQRLRHWHRLYSPLSRKSRAAWTRWRCACRRCSLVWIR